MIPKESPGVNRQEETNCEICKAKVVRNRQ